MPLALFLTSLAGLFLGLFGSGGSMLVLPVLVYVAHIPAHQAVGMSLLIVGTTSSLGCLLNVRGGVVDLRMGGIFALTGVAGAWIGANFTHLVPAQVLLVSFALLMLLIGGKILAQSTDHVQKPRTRPLVCVVAGTAVGILTGFFGVGGGFIILPALVLFGGLEMRSTIATSLGIIALNCCVGLASQLSYVSLNFPLALGFAAAASSGMLAGLAMANHIATPILRRAFGLSIVVLGALLLLKNLPNN